jgi:hypothetical protein
MQDSIDLREVLPPELFAAVEAGSTHIVMSEGFCTGIHGTPEECQRAIPEDEKSGRYVSAVSRQVAAHLLWWMERNVAGGILGSVCNRLAAEILSGE